MTRFFGTDGLMSFLPDAVRWYLTLMIVTWALAPVAWLACGRLADRGAFVARPLALLVVIWPNWFLASVTKVPYATAGLWATVAVIGVIGWALTIRGRQPLRDWIKLLIVAEGVSLIVFAGYAVLRGYAPNIAGTEKPMDAAMFAANRRATDMPPADPWMAGEKINYYYLGYTIHGSLARMSAVSTWVGFNLALATTFAMGVCAAAGLGFNTARAWFSARIAAGAGALAAFFVMFAGNMYAPVHFFQHPIRVWDTRWWDTIGWKASRIVIDAKPGDSINEFPSFSFVLGDLHPHVSALPFTLLALTLALNFLLTPRDAASPFAVSRWPGLVLAGAAIGALYPMNSWDFPTYLAAALLAIGLSFGFQRRALLAAGLVVAASVLAWAPFIVTFVPFATGTEQDLPKVLRGIPGVSGALKALAVYQGERTSAGEFLTVFGMPWLIAMIYFGVKFARKPEGSATVPRPALIFGAFVALIAILWPAPVLILAGAPLAAGVWLLWRDRDEPLSIDSIANLLFAAGFALVLITEFFYLRDVFQGRMNTLFKIYYQVWTLTGIASGLAIISLWLIARTWLVPRTLLTLAVAVSLIVGSVYPIVSEHGWINVDGPSAWHGLDGAAFAEEINPGDLAVAKWLVDNAKSNDVLLEAPGCSYIVNGGFPTSGVAAFSGVPTVIGWQGHEGQWRGGQPELEFRTQPPPGGLAGPLAQDVAAMYADPSSPLFDTYKVTLVLVGKYETDGPNDPQCKIAGPFEGVGVASYPGAGWTLVFESDGSRLFRRTT